MNKEELYNELKMQVLSRDLTIDKVEKAYLLADKLHSKQKRKDGTPYIIHPLQVSLILSELGFDNDILCAALLHDIVEDCGYTVKQIEEEFGQDVAQMVDTVSAIENEGVEFSGNNLYEEKDFKHQSLDEQTFKKLITYGRKNPRAFFVKFADRLNNLKTIGSFPYYKQIEKVRETQRWILPLAKILKSNYFYRQISNECFKILNKNEIDDFMYIYTHYVESSRKNLMKIIDVLKKYFAKYSQKIHVEYETLTEYEIYNFLLKKGVKNIKAMVQSELNIVPFYNIIITEKEILENSRFSFLYRQNFKYDNLFSIVNAGVDELSKNAYYLICDNARVMYNIYHLTNSEESIMTFGTDEQVKEVDIENTHEITTDFIRVKSRSGEIFFISENSTVLDFAFKIHKELGLAFKYATLNNSPTKHPPYTKINDGDMINIVTERDEKTGKVIFCPELKWLAYVNTENSKKALIKYFEKLYQEK